MSDYICRLCGCQCTPSGSKHTAGGPGMLSCGKKPVPVLRSDWDAEIAAEMATLRARWMGK